MPYHVCKSLLSPDHSPTTSDKSIHTEAVNSLSSGAAVMEVAGCLALHSLVDGGSQLFPCTAVPSPVSTTYCKAKGYNRPMHFDPLYNIQFCINLISNTS